MVHADVELAFVETPHRRVGEVETRIKGIGYIVPGIKPNQLFASIVEKSGWNLVAGGTARLRPMIVGHDGCTGSVTLEREARVGRSYRVGLTRLANLI